MPDEITGLDLIVPDAVAMKFTAAPVTKEQLGELIQISAAQIALTCAIGVHVGTQDGVDPSLDTPDAAGTTRANRHQAAW